jgi:endonuclease/exonuclease/phosphatase family metal-dependent hydrolase
VAIALLLGINLHVFSQHLTVGTFNLRYDNPDDEGNRWEQRKKAAADLIRFHEFDILGTQEGLKNQINDLSVFLPEYAHYGIGRDDGKDAGEHSTIFYRKDRFRLLKSGDFWLSETPEKPGLGWDATCCNRICSWVYLEDKRNGRKFYFFNAHFDHQGLIARAESAGLIIRKIKEIAGTAPAIFTGDLNGNRKTEWYEILSNSSFLTDTYTQVEHPYVPGPSFNNWGKKLNGNEVIDHIFVTEGLAAKRWGVLTDMFQGKFISDHFPVLAEISWPAKLRRTAEPKTKRAGALSTGGNKSREAGSAAPANKGN